MISNNEDSVICVDNLAPLGKSDHCIVTAEYRVSVASTMEQQTWRIYDKGDYQAMNNYLSRDWEKELSIFSTVDDKWKHFEEEFHNAIDMFIPKRTFQPGKKSKGRYRKTPLSLQTRKKVKEKNRLWKSYLKSRKIEDFELYKRVRNQVRRASRREERAYEKSVVEEVRGNPKKFWSFVKKKTQQHKGIPILKKPDGSSADFDLDKAETLGDFFASVLTNDPAEDITVEQRCDNVINECHISSSIILKKLEKVNSTKSAGPDELHPRVLKETKDSIASALALIFKDSLERGSLPLNWKKAHISALHKKGAKDLPGNYRPVSLTSVVCKVLESILRDKIMDHMRTNNLFSKYQYGFITGRSTVLQLLVVLDRWTQELDQGGIIDVLYFDFMKAFDRVPHKYLLAKLRSYGVHGQIYNWIEDFLSNRQQRVKVCSSFSKWYKVTSGIPQGSVLGPILFVIFINDLPERAKYSDVFLFADDLKIFRPIANVNDQHKLQEDVNSLNSWSKESCLFFHPDKCKSMRISTRPQPEVGYYLDGKLVTKSQEEKDIGVIIDPALSFDAHISAKIKKANSVLGIIARSFEYKDKDIMLTLYKALVRPHLEYANQIWAPYLVKHVVAIESVQRRMTRQVPGLKDLSYEDRLRELCLPTLAYRRLRGDMIELYKIATGKYDPAVTAELLDFSHLQHTRGHRYKLVCQRANTSKRKNSFFVRTVELWNSLPSVVVEAQSVIAFERQLDKQWSNHPIKYDYRASPSHTRMQQFRQFLLS